MSKKITIGDRSFDSHTESRAFTSTLLGRYKIGDVVLESDLVFVRGLLERHPNQAEKVRAGIKRFEITHGRSGSVCFAVRGQDGALIDFSYKKCIPGKTGL